MTMGILRMVATAFALGALSCQVVSIANAGGVDEDQETDVQSACSQLPRAVARGSRRGESAVERRIQSRHVGHGRESRRRGLRGCIYRR